MAAIYIKSGSYVTLIYSYINYWIAVFLCICGGNRHGDLYLGGLKILNILV